jgi:hypothetical protein
MTEDANTRFMQFIGLAIDAHLNEVDRAFVRATILNQPLRFALQMRAHGGKKLNSTQCAEVVLEACRRACEGVS